MNSKRHILLPAALLASIWAWETSAQVPVTDAQGTGRAAPSQSAPPRNEVLVDLMLQLQALQTEVQNLRGIVEEQGYQIRRMEQEQRDRYLDLDRRLSAFGTGGAPAPGLTPPPGALPPGDPSAGTQESQAGIAGAPAQQPAGDAIAGLPPTGSDFGIPPVVDAPRASTAMPANEQELYRTALNLLLEENNYEQAVSLFQQYIDNYPDGVYITNAYYWQGEALILVARYNQAKDVFSKVIEDFPNDPKAPGAMLKLGVVYSRMGDNRLATQVWRDIQTRYPESLTEIRAAEDYLRRSAN